MDRSMVKKTAAWWERVLADPAKLNYWLVRLYNNEKDAEQRFTNFANEYCRSDPEAYYLLLFIAQQERRHASMVRAVCEARGITVFENSSANERYWSKVLPCVLDKLTAAGVGALAEQLSLERMRVIISYKETPDDLRQLFKQIEPDESLHAKGLANLATQKGISGVIDCHSEGLIALGLKIRGETSGPNKPAAG